MKPSQAAQAAGLLALGLCLCAAAPVAPAPKPVGPVVGQPASRPKPAAPPRRPPRPAGTAAMIGAANAQARAWPTPAAYVNSALFYDYEPGRIYTIQTSPRFLTTIALKPGEKLISKAAGDTVRWVLGETETGSGDNSQVIVLVKPIRPDLRTNFVLMTDQRVYLIDASSSGGAAYTSVLSWNYPQEQGGAALAGKSVSARSGPSSAPLAVEALDFNYRIETLKGRTPRWRPVRVFDDGSKTFLEFPADLATTEAPPLFLLGDKDQAELVNYRVNGRYYVVDRLIERAELRLGGRPQTVVRITRTAGRR